MRSNRMVSCIYCGTNNFSENRIRCVVEQLFKKPFITRRNIFSTDLINHAYNILKLERKLISKRKTNIPAWLEIDMYCEELRLAIEHNGSQHYLISKNGYTNNKEKLLKIQNRDKAKRYLCKILGIKLIVLKQLPDPSLTGIKSHIEKPLREIGYSFSNIEWESIELSVFDTAYSEKVSHNLSLWGYHVHTAPPYIQKSVIIYTCDQNHYRFSSAAAIHAGHKCLECAGRAAWRPNQIADALLQLNYIAFSDLRGTTADTHIQVGCKICLNGIKWLRTKNPKKSSNFTIRRRTLSQHVKLSDENISTIQLKNPENPSRPECLGCLWLNRFLSYLREIKYDGRISKSETREWFRKLRVHELSAFPKTLLDCVENRDWDRIEELLSIPEKPTLFNK